MGGKVVEKGGQWDTHEYMISHVRLKIGGKMALFDKETLNEGAKGMWDGLGKFKGKNERERYGLLIIHIDHSMEIVYTSASGDTRPNLVWPDPIQN